MDGLVVELRAQLITYIKDKDCPSKIKKKQGGTPEDIMKIINYLSSVLAANGFIFWREENRGSR